MNIFHRRTAHYHHLFGGAVEPFNARNINLEKHIRFGVRLIVVIVPLSDIAPEIEEFLWFLRLLFFFRTN